MEHYSLSALMEKIKDSLQTSFPLPLWVVAEVSEMKVNYSGHCYLELVEKEGADGLKLKAKVSANIWANKFRLLKTYFESSTRIALAEGIKILIRVDVRFHEIYGLSLNVVDIDPAFTIGDLKLQRNLILQRLQDEGIIDLNKELGIAAVPQRIAVISSATAAGYQDFVNHLVANAWGYRFSVDFFSAVMQGNEAETSIVSALDSIYANYDSYDVVVIIRGGGSQTDLLCFDSYTVAANIAQFPLPVLSGIGHDKDESVVDVVAYQNFKTPTAVAAFLLDMLAEFEDEVRRCLVEIAHFAQRLVATAKEETINTEFVLLDNVRRTIKQQSQAIDWLTMDIIASTNGRVATERKLLESASYSVNKQTRTAIVQGRGVVEEANNRLVFNAKSLLMQRNFALQNLESKLQSAKPDEIMKRGYSLTLIDGTLVTSSLGLEGKAITTILREGQIESMVTHVNNK